MKFKYIKRNIKVFFLLTILIVSSCSKNEAEPLFDNESATRIDNRINELRELLKSSPEGWRAVFFTDDTRFGGYTFNFRFKDDRVVEMISDFSGDGVSRVESEYDINLGATINLVFTSSGLIHDIANNTNEGDFEFLYYEQDGEDLIFRTNRLFKEVRFEKIGADDWTNFNLLDTNVNRLRNSVFKSLKVGSDVYPISYDNGTRFASTSLMNFGIGFTTTGLVISPAVDVGGEKVRNFDYDVTREEFVATDENGTELASIISPNTPGGVLTPYDFGNENGNLRVLRTNAGFLSRDISNDAFVTFFENWRTDFQNNNSGRFISRVYIRDIDETISYVDIWIEGPAGRDRARLDCTFVITQDTLGNDIVTFTLDATSAANQDFGFALDLKPMTDFIFKSSGFYLQKMTDLNGTQQTIGLIPVDNTTMLSHWYDF